MQNKRTFDCKGYVKAVKDEVIKHLSPCDVCKYSPPSSFDGKPCTVCPATPIYTEEDDE